MGVTPEIFKQGMRQLGGAVTVATTAYEDQLGGLTVTSVMSMTAEPPRLIACINKSGTTFSILSKSQRFCINVLSADQIAVAERFAGLRDLNLEDRFDGIDWHTGVTGVPMIDGALACFDCQVSEMIEANSHGVIVGDIQSVEVSQANNAPLFYMNGQFATIDDQYRH